MSERNVRERLARKLLRLLAQAHDKGARLSYRLGVNNSPGVFGCTCADQDHNVSFDDTDISAFVDLLLGNTVPTPPCT